MHVLMMTSHLKYYYYLYITLKLTFYIRKHTKNFGLVAQTIYELRKEKRTFSVGTKCEFAFI